MEWVRGNDWGGYDYNVRNQELHDDGECMFFISQAGGLGTPKLIKTAKDAGQITGLYWWNQALQSAQYQIDTFSEHIATLDPDFVWIDFEHWWVVWQEYWDAVYGIRTWDTVQKLPPQKISDNGQFLTEGIVKNFPELYTLVYSADWFIKGYSPQSVNWIKNRPFAVASYPDYGVEKYTLTWDQIRAWNFKHRLSGIQVLTDWQPTMPVGLPKWDMWQYSSRIMIPGEYYAYDWVAFDGDLDTLKFKCGLGPPVEGPPTVQDQLDDHERRIRILEEQHGLAPTP